MLPFGSLFNNGFVFEPSVAAIVSSYFAIRVETLLFSMFAFRLVGISYPRQKPMKIKIVKILLELM